MAKKSAFSKGYRKTVKKKPFLTKKEIIALVVIVAAILLGLVLFNIFYDDGYLGADEVQTGDIVSYASTDLRSRYKKVGEVGEIEGFTLEERPADATPIEAYTFIPDAETDNITSVSVSGSFVNAAELAASTLSYMGAFIESDPDATTTTTFTDVTTAEIQGHDAYLFSYNYSAYVAPEGEAAEAPAEEAAEAETPAPNTFTQNVSAYVDLDGQHTLCLHIYREGDSDAFYISDEELVDFVQKYSTSFTMAAVEE